MEIGALADYGWSARWAERLGAFPEGAVPARVIRHDGTALRVVTPTGVLAATLSRRLAPEPTVGDWVAIVDGEPIGILERSSLLRRRAAVSDTEQVLAANVDTVFLVCGLDRPVNAGRIQRGAVIAADAGAEPVLVLTKAALVDDIDEIARATAEAHPQIPLVVTSVREGLGIDLLRSRARDRTVVLLGESGAGKSSIVNALLGTEAAAVGAVRSSDSKGRHTTTDRVLHLLPDGGALIDSPGIRSIGLWTENETVTATFADVAALASECRFGDCSHGTEPGCAVRTAVASGALSASRLTAWRALGEETKVVPRSRRGRRKPARPRRR